VFFKGDGMDHVEGDTMPSESEFVSTLDKRRPTGKVPPLEATEAQLRAFPAKPQPVQPAPAAPAAPANYPPLESPAR
jgi:outer membrane protein assembly factor BamE